MSENSKDSWLFVLLLIIMAVVSMGFLVFCFSCC